MKNIFFLIGPTCSGKTAVSLELAKKYPFEIISIDSMQVYKGMDIGTAKVSLKDRNLVLHHMIDIREVWEEFSVYDYREESLKVIESIFSRGKIPLVVGGSGFYINTLIYGIRESGHSKLLRNNLEREYDELGKDVLYDKLVKLSPEIASNIHKNDKKRLIRGLEIAILGGDKYTPPINELGYNCKLLGILWERSILYGMAEKRVEKMVKSGLFEEVEGLLGKFSKTTSQAVGYKEIISFFEGKFSREDAVNEIKRNTRRLIKKQFTWFKRDAGINWIKAEPGKSVKKIALNIDLFLSKIMNDNNLHL